MRLKDKLKVSIITSFINKSKKNNPFDENSAELFQLPEDADGNMNNSYYFSAHDIGERNSLIFRLGKRGGAYYEVWFACRDSKGAYWVNIKQLFKVADCPVSVKCLEAGKKWDFNFKGKLEKTFLNKDLQAIPAGQGAEPENLQETEQETGQKTGHETGQAGEQQTMASFEGTFTATTGIFEFSRHMDTTPIARALSKEKWSRSFLNSLKENHQVHYEQQGEIEGTLVLNGRQSKIKCSAMRDHSYGKRDWDYMDRHIWLMALLENGDALNVNMVRYPAVSEIQTGYLISEGRTTCIDSVTSMDNLECNGHVPSVFQYTVKFADGRTLLVTCKKELEFIFPFNDGKYTIFEGIGSFSLDNGIKGRGIIEFGFNANASRWSRS